MLFVKDQCLAASVDFVRQNVFQLATVALPIPGHYLPEKFRVIERFKIQPLNSGMTIHQTDTRRQFCAGLRIGVGFLLNDGPNSGLGQTDDTTGNAVGLELKRDPLPHVDCRSYIQTVCLL